MPDPLFSMPMIEKFISFNTISHNSNLGLIHFVRDYHQLRDEVDADP